MSHLFQLRAESPMDRSLKITAYTVTTAAGRGVADHLKALEGDASALRPCDFDSIDLQTWIGRVDGVEDAAIDGVLRDYDCRNNRLAMLGIQQDGFVQEVDRAKRAYGADRVGLFMGTSTSGIGQTEVAYASRDPRTGALPKDYNYRTTHNMYSGAGFCRRLLGLSGPAQAISTACSSSAKVFGTAYRYMRAGLCDAAVVAGVDSLCEMTLMGFNSLQLVSSEPCRPFDRDRDGINIGEAAGFALLEWPSDDADVCLLGYGESSDAYHMSRPHPEGAGAVLSMEKALSSAGLRPTDIDYVNLHGTATPANDLAEDRALMTIFDGQVACSSTKGVTGHTLGAAGIVEAIFSCIAVTHDLLPGTHNMLHVDPAIQSRILLEPQLRPVRRVLSNSFGFGGSNASLVIGQPL
jgi:3-oxoacyl-[acyl-carrier-protein] synthase-1